MQRIALVIALAAGSQGCFTHASHMKAPTNSQVVHGLLWTGIVVGGVVLGGLAASGKLDSTTHRPAPMPSGDPQWPAP